MSPPAQEGAAETRPPSPERFLPIWSEAKFAVVFCGDLDHVQCVTVIVLNLLEWRRLCPGSRASEGHCGKACVTGRKGVAFSVLVSHLQPGKSPPGNAVLCVGTVLLSSFPSCFQHQMLSQLLLLGKDGTVCLWLHMWRGGRVAQAGLCAAVPRAQQTPAAVPELPQG